MEDLCVDGRIILKLILKIGWKIVDWIDLARNRDKWQDVVNAVVNIRVPQMRGIS
jgi:hypothetical protein